MTRLNLQSLLPRLFGALIAGFAATFLLAAPAQAQRVSLQQLLGEIQALNERITELEAAGGTQKFIFITDFPSNGNLGGLTGADRTCQSDADAASLPGVYKAWLSLSTVGPQSTFVPARIPYVLPGSLDVVANDWTELTSGVLVNAIERHADGTLIATGQEFWTGTTATGLPRLNIVLDYPFQQATQFSCDGWLTEIRERSGTVGTSEAVVSTTWSEGTELTCDTELRHICVQQ